MWKLPLLFVLGALLTSSTTLANNATQVPEASQTNPIQHVVLLALDGISTEGLQEAHTPNFDKLAESGVYLSRSRGVMPTKSAPNWASILSGVYPNDHGIHSNQWWWFRFKRRLGYPTLFTAVKTANPQAPTAAIYEWNHFGKLFHPKDLDYRRWVPEYAATTTETANLLGGGTPRFTVIHLVSADMAGHEHTWGSPAYIQGIEFVDSQVGTIVKQLKANGTLNQTLLVLASDHGGVDHGHGGSSDTELYTAVVFNGPGVKQGLRLKGMTQNVDITATLYDVLGLTPKVPLKGIPLKIIWE